MRLNLLSDLHLSKAGLDVPDNDADLVVLAGDIARPDAAVQWAMQIRKPVLYVPGNHEFYGGSLSGTVQRLRELSAGSNVRILHDDEVVVGGVRFLGTPLWTDFLLYGDGQLRDAAVQEAMRRMYDFQRIYLDEQCQQVFTPLDSACLFLRHSAWLEHGLGKRFDGPTVVVSHHAPSPRSIDPRFEGSLLNACFASHAEHLLNGGRAVLWMHGHMHHSVDYRLHGVRVVSNPRGYFMGGRPENPRFDINFTVTV
ncbi:metallophosphoesterase [Ramlibacter henchirensis]|uniref:Metallophosphoesterase n=1 Tax=Ramlibacter henchirensis TaxID=204072 RepID=A0A4Z0C6Z9_9BURK|nr:metallophosphoesterase [Ramlibacter henchirensis]TFZ06158.1 metallophosphoesterase [Ramlibacter henchirensis]